MLHSLGELNDSSGIGIVDECCRDRMDSVATTEQKRLAIWQNRRCLARIRLELALLIDTICTQRRDLERLRSTNFKCPVLIGGKLQRTDYRVDGSRCNPAYFPCEKPFPSPGNPATFRCLQGGGYHRQAQDQ